MLGIIGAMEVEVKLLKEKISEMEVFRKASMDFYKGNLCGREVVVVKSGIGKVNAGICTQILVDLFDVDTIINTGIAGSLSKDIAIGDIVLSTEALQHDVDAIGFGYEPGVIPQMDRSVFIADEPLKALAKKCCEKVNPDVNVFEGRVVSGDQFISDQEKKDKIINQFGGLCTEMEGAAIAQAAYLNGIPFLIVRAISDQADDSAAIDYPAFEKLAVETSVRLIEAICEKL